jgi:hypothetical protein
VSEQITGALVSWVVLGLLLTPYCCGMSARSLVHEMRPVRSNSASATYRFPFPGTEPLVRDLPRVFAIGLASRIIGAGRLSHLLQCVVYCVAE